MFLLTFAAFNLTHPLSRGTCRTFSSLLKHTKGVSKEYKKQVEDDQTRCKNKFFPKFKAALARAKRQRMTEPDEEAVRKQSEAAAEAMKEEDAGQIFS